VKRQRNAAGFGKSDLTPTEDLNKVSRVAEGEIVKAINTSTAEKKGSETGFDSGEGLE
jgi:hypothetical protein